MIHLKIENKANTVGEHADFLRGIVYEIGQGYRKGTGWKFQVEQEEKKPVQTKIKVGDTIFVEQAWEDEQGNYHDEYAKVIGIKDGLLDLDFQVEGDKLKEFLKEAEYKAEDYEDCIECEHEYEDGVCKKCNEPHPGPDDFTGATPGDR